ncbi:MAG TPA: PAS domain-containing protein, partial [Blastocatellia bacterium]|nr:PAS domain-containing protein [Blastocatellia bacterium]
MKLGAVENKARMAMALFVVALLLAAAMSLALYWQSQRELATERVKQLRLESAVVAARLGDEISDASLKQALVASEISASATVVKPDGQVRAKVSTLDRLPPDDLPTAVPETSSPTTEVRTTRGFDIIGVALDNGERLLMAKPAATNASPFVVYLFSYQIIALVFGLGILFLVVRWLLKPYRRILEAAKDSPVRVSSAMGETEFVVDTFQALVGQLQDKERELAALHELERMRADKSERFSERLIANIPSGLVAMNSRGTVTSANQYAREIFGEAKHVAQAGATHGRTGGLQELSVDYRAFFAAAPRIIPMVSECLSNGTPVRRGEVELVYADGRTLRLGLSISPITDTDQTVEGALCMMTDITEVTDLRERMKLQENLANLGEMA